MSKHCMVYCNTSVYQAAEGRPALHLSLPLAPLFSRLRRSPLGTFGAPVAFETVPHRRLRPQARTWLAHAAVISPANTQANWPGRQLRMPALVAHAYFLKVGHFAPFSQFLHIKNQNFPDVFYRLTSTYDSYERWKVSWKSVCTFFQNPEDRHTRRDRRCNFIYID